MKRWYALYVFLYSFDTVHLHTNLFLTGHLENRTRYFQKISFLNIHIKENWHVWKTRETKMLQVQRLSTIAMGLCKKDMTTLLMHWSYIFLALTHPCLHTVHPMKHVLGFVVLCFVIVIINFYRFMRPIYPYFSVLIFLHWGNSKFQY